MPLTAFAEGAIFGERFGGGAPQILALHGWGRNRLDFTHILNGLDAIAVDLPGFGASPAPPSAWGSNEYASAIQEVLRHFSQPPIIVGHSFGGRVATTLAASDSAQVSALVLTGVPLLRPNRARPRQSGRYKVYRLLHRMRLLDDMRMERIRRRYGSLDYRQASGVMRQVLVRVVNESYENALGRLRCPVELVWGEQDSVVPLDVALRAQRIVRQANVTVCPDGDHYSVLLEGNILRNTIQKYYK